MLVGYICSLRPTTAHTRAGTARSMRTSSLACSLKLRMVAGARLVVHV